MDSLQQRLAKLKADDTTTGARVEAHPLQDSASCPAAVLTQLPNMEDLLTTKAKEDAAAVVKEEEAAALNKKYKEEMLEKEYNKEQEAKQARAATNKMYQDELSTKAPKPSAMPSAGAFALPPTATSKPSKFLKYSKLHTGDHSSGAFSVDEFTLTGKPLIKLDRRGQKQKRVLYLAHGGRYLCCGKGKGHEVTTGKTALGKVTGKGKITGKQFLLEEIVSVTALEQKEMVAVDSKEMYKEAIKGFTFKQPMRTIEQLADIRYPEERRSGGYSFTIEHPTRTLELMVSTEAERDELVSHITALIKAAVECHGQAEAV